MSIYHSARGTNSYTVVGTPTVTNNIVSNCDSSNYVTINSSVYASVVEEICVKIRKNGVNNNRAFFQFTQSSTLQLAYNSTSIWAACFNSMTALGSYVEIGGISTNNAPDGHDYWIKLTNKNNIVSLYISTDGENFILTDSKEVVYSSSMYSYQIDIFKGENNSQNSIDLNQTYIRVNNTAWFGICPLKVKKHQIMGPVGYTIQGSPTISDGIVSNFSASNFLQSTSLFDSASAFDNLEVQTKITVPTGISSSGQQILYFPFEGLYSGFRIYANNAVSWYIFSNRITIDSGFIMTPGNSYFIKATMINKIATLYIKEEGQSWQSYGTVDCSQENPTANEPFIIGTFGADHSHYFTGSIDLNQTYIKINDKVWFYQPQETKYIIRNDKLVWADPRLALSGPVNYTVVGSPTINDGVASGFSGSDYLSLPATLDISQNFELVFCITTDDLQAEQRIFAYDTGTINSVYIQNKYLKWWITGNSSNILSTDALNPNTRYFIKCSNVNGLYSLSYSTDRITYTGLRIKELSLSTTISSYYDIGVNHTSYYSPFIGSIDLNETYIKVNDQLWFYGKNYATQNIAPVPAGFTYGTTTTSAIGYVDMHTQTFTASPQGTTISR